MGAAGGSIELSTALSGGRARLAVTDSGPGVPPGGEQRLFEAGGPALAGRGGPGLAAARAVAEEHGGRLLLERPPAGGVRLVLELPLAGAGPETPAALPSSQAPPEAPMPPPEAQPEAPAPAVSPEATAPLSEAPSEAPTPEPPAPSAREAPAPDGEAAAVSPPQPPAFDAAPEARPARLLVVDDDPTLLTLARELLRAEGYAVELAASTDEALELLAREPVDLVLADLQMPGRGGDELYAEIRARWPALVPRTLFITGDLESDRARRLFGEGGAPYLRKPFLRYELLEAVRTLLARG